MDKLAIDGGPKTIKKPFKKYNSIGHEEVEAAKKVIESGVLSQFIGAHDPDFFGGPKVKEFEKNAADFFNVKHVISVNSWTSGLIAAVGALNISPGDEIIVPTWTMCASATAILHWNAIPVFADIEDKTFNIDPKSVKKNISPRTKAIMSVDIFGHPANYDEICKIAKDNNLMVISDTAQSPGAIYKNEYAGTITDIGGFSLNYHKHIHTGEGGLLTTNDDNLAQRMQLIRNHAEAAVKGLGVSNIANMIGHNFRLGEIECAIGIEQLKKLDKLVESRQNIAFKLIDGLSNLKGLQLPHIEDGCSHVFYVFPMKVDTDLLNVTRKKIFNALVAEGIEGLAEGYANIHLLPMYQKKIAYGNDGFPWNSEICSRDVIYDKGICPVAEKLNDQTFLGYEMCLHDLTEDDCDLVIKSFQKVWKNLDQL